MIHFCCNGEKLGMKHTVTLIPGDGIGSEVVASAKRIIEEAGVSVEWDICEAGAQSFKRGIITGVPEITLESIKKNKVVLKGPLETPIGFGEKSANVTLRKLFDTYGNIRPVKRIPGIGGPYANDPIDMIIVRENVEDLYTGIEHMQTPNVAQALKLISRRGCERIIRLAFAIAQAEGRKKVHCATKANILKLTEGMMKRVFEEVSKDYPDIQANHIIVDNCAHQMVMDPTQFDVVVMTNLHGDILSDLGSALVGGLGIAPGANYGDEVAIFEAVHGAAPDIAGQGKANPTAVLSSAIMMLRHLNEHKAANLIEQSLYVTISEGKFLTGDICKNGAQGSTQEYTDQIVRNLGKEHSEWAERTYRALNIFPVSTQSDITSQTLFGVDVFLDGKQNASGIIGPKIEKILEQSPFKLKMIANVGMQVYPTLGGVETYEEAPYQCRIIKKTDTDCSEDDISSMLALLSKEFSWIHIEKLYLLNEKASFTKVQGED